MLRNFELIIFWFDFLLSKSKIKWQKLFSFLNDNIKKNVDSKLTDSD